MSRRGWSLARVWIVLTIFVANVAFGVGVYVFLGSHRTVQAHALRPEEATKGKDGPINHLPGTIAIVQDGTLYRLQRGIFTPVLNSPGGAARWMQPSYAPDGQSLLVVRRDYAYSDLYQISPGGQVLGQLTHNASKTVELNHWVFYPRETADGSSVFFSYDPKDRFANYNVVLAVWSMRFGASFTQAKKWTSPQSYTGGDIQPIPLPSGGVIYTKYSFDQATSKILGQLWLTPRAGAAGRPLTTAQEDCSQPSLSPDGLRLAMICTGAKEFANVEIAAFDGTNLGPRQVLVSSQLAAQPTWAPDGSGLVYLAPLGSGGHFQLWLQRIPPALLPTAAPVPGPTAPAQGARASRAATPAPTPTPVTTTPAPAPPPLPAPIALTSNLDFDATSTIAWHG